MLSTKSTECIRNQNARNMCPATALSSHLGPQLSSGSEDRTASLWTGALVLGGMVPCSVGTRIDHCRKRQAPTSCYREINITCHAGEWKGTSSSIRGSFAMNQANLHGIELYLQEITPVSILHCARSVVSVPVGVSPPPHTIIAKPQRRAATKPWPNFWL